MRRLLLAAAVVILAAAPTAQAGRGRDLDRGRHGCGRVEGTPVAAYNLSCDHAARIWSRSLGGSLPKGWTGVNRDVDGGQALLFRNRDWDRVTAAETDRGLSLRRLEGAPVVLARVPYEVASESQLGRRAPDYGLAADRRQGGFVPCHPYDASQGRAAGPYAVRARRISCRQAKRIGRTFVRHGEAALPGWRCDSRRKGLEGTAITCRRRPAVVRFFAGA